MKPEKTPGLHPKRHIIISLLLIATMMFALTSCASKTNSSSSEDASAISSDVSSSLSLAETSENSENQAEATIFLASDYQYNEAYPKPAENLTQILKTIDKESIEIDHAIIGGDYSNDEVKNDYNFDPDDGISEIKEILADNTDKLTDDNTIFIQGNHDQMSDQISDSGLHEYDDYLVYVMNTQTDFPWRQGLVNQKKTVRESAKRLEKCLKTLIQNGETRPVFIACHVPLHFSLRTCSELKRGDNLYSSLVFNVVNEAAENLDIVYLVGHNHSKAYDSYLGCSAIYQTIGDKLLIPDFTVDKTTTDSYTAESLNFTYLNYGYVGYVKTNSSPSDKTLSGTIATIYPDRIEFARYSKYGQIHMGADGCACEDPDDSWLISKKYYSKETNKTEIVERQHAK